MIARLISEQIQIHEVHSSDSDAGGIPPSIQHDHELQARNLALPLPWAGGNSVAIQWQSNVLGA